MKTPAMTPLTAPLKVDLKHVHLTDEQFDQLCIDNPDLDIERSAKGVLIFMSPVGGEGGSQEADFIIDLGNWNRQSNNAAVSRVQGFIAVFTIISRCIGFQIH